MTVMILSCSRCRVILQSMPCYPDLTHVHTVTATSYILTNRVPNRYVTSGTSILWVSDGSVAYSGWTFCSSSSISTPPPTPNPTYYYGYYPPPPPPYSVGTSNNGGLSIPSSEGDPRAKELGIMSAIFLAAIFVSACCIVCVCCACCLYPCKQCVRGFPKVSPGVLVGCLIVVLVMAAMGTTDTIRLKIDSTEMQIGIFRWAINTPSASGSVSCAFDEPPSASDPADVCFASQDSACCKSRTSRCKAAKAFSILGFFLTLVAVIFETVRGLRFQSWPVNVSIILCMMAAVCYWFTYSMVALNVFGWVVIDGDNGGKKFNEGASCGLWYWGSESGYLVTPSAGYSLFQIAFGLCFVQAGLYSWWANRDQDTVTNPNVQGVPPGPPQYNYANDAPQANYALSPPNDGQKRTHTVTNESYEF
jgi:hypothetical protein